jgi:hypothetical protein
VDAVSDCVVRVDVPSSIVSDITGNMSEDVSFGGDGERDGFEVG